MGTLYRKIKCSNRLPDKPDRYHVIQEYEGKLTPYVAWWTGRDWKEFGIESWLEETPDVSKDDIFRQIAGMCHNDEAARQAAQAIHKPFYGEE